MPGRAVSGGRVRGQRWAFARGETEGRRAGRRAWRGRSQRTVPPAAQTGHVSLKGGGRCLVTCSALRPRTRGRGSGDVTGQRPTAGPERPGQGRVTTANDVI